MREYPGFCQDYLRLGALAKHDKTHMEAITQSSDAKNLCDQYMQSRQSRDTGSLHVNDNLVNLLNYFSEKIHDEIPPHGNAKKIVFVACNGVTMLNHHPKYADIKFTPDIVAILETTKVQYDQQDCASIAWHHLLSTIEEIESKSASSQGGTYLTYACQARPDVAAMYGVSFAPTGYTILYNDPVDVVASTEIDVNDLLPLASYVFALYNLTPGAHQIRDTSITLASRLSEEPRWTITFKNVTYRDCYVRFVGSPHGRQTWIAVCEEPLAVIKDSWWSDTRNWNEGELFNVLHEKGGVPGWVQIRSEGQVPLECHSDASNPTYLSTFCTGTHSVRKFKKRIVMSTFGEHLSRCGNVLKFLTAMYDVLEAHRFAVIHRNILHRDISMDILVHPKGVDPEPMAGPRPKFIHEIVDGVEHAPPVAVLCDLDNGCELDRSKAKTPAFLKRKTTRISEGAHWRFSRVGTPMYAARGICEAGLLRNYIYESMPPIPEAIQARYLAAHTCVRPSITNPVFARWRRYFPWLNTTGRAGTIHLATAV
ncbi:hypothetical protein HGRIS_010914 [Hohenbuehelia grisea]|uniref:Fungal-type protein kinase domain-containing protein n=1 Tax=Hohenbuehelia grisea TaxID=104357 RepID=A0ABR3IYM8_9AGAR